MHRRLPCDAAQHGGALLGLGAKHFVEIFAEQPQVAALARALPPPVSRREHPHVDSSRLAAAESAARIGRPNRQRMFPILVKIRISTIRIFALLPPGKNISGA